MFGVAILALLAFGYALVSRKLSTTMVTGPIVFTLLGLMLGSGSVNLVTLELENNLVQLLLEGTLVVVLFSDAAAISLKTVRAELAIPRRLLGIGLPLTIVSGTLAGLVLLDAVSFWQAAVIAVVLAPTDAALGKSIVGNKAVPAVVRQGINVESGLNDGIVVPFLAIAVAGTAGEMQTVSGIVTVFAGEIGWAVAAGALIGWAGAKAILYAGARGWTAPGWRMIAVPLLAVSAFGLASPLGGSGFLAAFVAGITFGAFVRSTYPNICDFSDEMAELLTMVAFFVFGALILVPSLPLITWPMVWFGLTVLTIARMIPVAMSLIGTHMKAPTVAYLGWFGPRGLASLVFVGTVVVEADLVNGPKILAVVATVVAMSVVLHGATAVPWSAAYGRWWARSEGTQRESMTEAVEVEQMPNRKRIQGPEH